MASFCGFCGRPLADGEVCNCQQPSGYPNVNYPPRKEPVAGAPYGAGQAQSFTEELKNRIGVGDPELNEGDVFEEGKQIVPDCVTPNEGEIPVKQYTVARLQSRVIGIPYARATGRIQVTNKRVLFRAPGRGIGGRTTLQHEFAIDELAGIEARREYVFNAFDLFLGVLLASIGGAIGSGIARGMLSHGGKPIGIFFLCLVLSAVGFCLFFAVKKQWLWKLLALGVGLAPTAAFGFMLFSQRHRIDQGAGFFGFLLIVVALLLLVMVIFALVYQSLRPNLVLLVKTKAAHEAIDIKRRKFGPFGAVQEDHTGYREIYPLEDAERCIRELNAVISDIQKLGDFGIDKWKKA